LHVDLSIYRPDRNTSPAAGLEVGITFHMFNMFWHEKQRHWRSMVKDYEPDHRPGCWILYESSGKTSTSEAEFPMSSKDWALL
jgi:hypothetical protein